MKDFCVVWHSEDGIQTKVYHKYQCAINFIIKNLMHVENSTTDNSAQIYNLTKGYNNKITENFNW